RDGTRKRDQIREATRADGLGNPRAGTQPGSAGSSLNVLCTRRRLPDLSRRPSVKAAASRQPLHGASDRSLDREMFVVVQQAAATWTSLDQGSAAVRPGRVGARYSVHAGTPGLKPTIRPVDRSSTQLAPRR